MSKRPIIYVRSAHNNRRRKWHVDDGEREPWENHKGEVHFWLVTRCGRRILDADSNERITEQPENVCTLCSEHRPTVRSEGRT